MSSSHEAIDEVIVALNACRCPDGQKLVGPFLDPSTISESFWLDFADKHGQCSLIRNPWRLGQQSIPPRIPCVRIRDGRSEEVRCAFVGERRHFCARIQENLVQLIKHRSLWMIGVHRCVESPVNAVSFFNEVPHNIVRYSCAGKKNVRSGTRACRAAESSCMTLVCAGCWSACAGQTSHPSTSLGRYWKGQCQSKERQQRCCQKEPDQRALEEQHEQFCRMCKVRELVNATASVSNDGRRGAESSVISVLLCFELKQTSRQTDSRICAATQKEGRHIHAQGKSDIGERLDQRQSCMGGVKRRLLGAVEGSFNRRYRTTTHIRVP